MIGRQLQHHQCFHEPKLNFGSGKIVKGKCVEPFKKIVGIQHSLIYITKGAFLKKSPLDSLGVCRFGFGRFSKCWPTETEIFGL